MKNKSINSIELVHHCPQCNKEKVYRLQHHFDKAVKSKRLCNHCHALKWIEDARSTIISNPKGIALMDEMNKKGYHFIHGTNGGEYNIGRYFLDGYDEINGIVFEYDEPFHELPLRKKLDLKRQDEIFLLFLLEGKKVRFIRYSEVYQNFYEVFPSDECMKYYEKYKI